MTKTFSKVDKTAKQQKVDSKIDTQKQQQELGAAVQMFLESGYYTKRRLFIFSFLKGMATGVGGVIGATVVIALLLWVLSLFSEVPFINHFTDQIQGQIEKAQD